MIASVTAMFLAYRWSRTALADEASVTAMFLADSWSRTALADDSERHGHVLGLPLAQDC